MSAFASLTRHYRWIDHPDTQAKFDNKIYQTMIAARFGLRVPMQIVTREIGALNQFLSGGERVIKQISPFGLVRLEIDEQAIFTSLINSTSPTQLVEFCPTYVQERVRKQADVRVTVINDDVFVHEIRPELGEDQIIDFRERSADVIAEAFLPPSMVCSLKSFLKSEDVHFACCDFGRVDQQYFFFEANVAGNWLWLEHASNSGISEAIANALLK